MWFGLGFMVPKLKGLKSDWVERDDTKELGVVVLNSTSRLIQEVYKPRNYDPQSKNEHLIN